MVHLRQGVIQQVQFIKWTTPIVLVLKSDAAKQTYGEYNITVHQVSFLDKYPLPRIKDLFTSLSGGKLFTQNWIWLMYTNSYY